VQNTSFKCFLGHFKEPIVPADFHRLVHVGMILKDFSEPSISLNRTRWVGERGFQNCTSVWDYRKFQFNCNFLTDQKSDLNTSSHRDLDREAQG